MKKPLQKLRRFFARTSAKRLNAATTREALANYDDDDGSNRLSGAFVIVLILHVVALVGVFAFARIKDSRAAANATLATNTNQPLATPAPAKPVTETRPPQTERTVESRQEPVAQLAAARAEPTTAPARSNPGQRSHIVKPGETLTRIGLAYNQSIPELMKTNGLKSDSDLKAGQVLIIPEGKSAAKPLVEPKPVAKVQENKAPAQAVSQQAKGTSYVVKKNDTLAKISRETGVKYEELVKLNSIKDPRKIQEGQTLKLPKKG
jgi:LysM repeat protein